MNYALVITTDGRPGLLEATLASFFRRVWPYPDVVAIVDDSGDRERHRSLDALCRDHAASLGSRWTLVAHPERRGFCATVADAWALASAEGGQPWVFWTEDDFEFERSVDLTELARVLDADRRVAQMSLMRGPVNDVERDAGGLIGLYHDRYTRMGSGASVWLRSRTNFSTTTSLIRRSFMAENPWPAYESECEGKFSIDLLARGYEFAVWGNGEPWTRHVGDVRAGTGY